MLDTVSAIGGYGGYSTGTMFLKKNDVIFINVGGTGTDCSTKIGNNQIYGGYNGGGHGGWINNTGWGAGGGATHVALESGLLYTFAEKVNKLLLVAGAGGGGGTFSNAASTQVYVNNGGNAGGYIANNGKETVVGNVSYGGNQITGGDGQGTYPSGSFGLGGELNTSASGAGGGAGYFGGGSGYSNGSSGAGGSGYIGNENLTNRVMYCYDCQEPDINDENYESIKTFSTTDVSEQPISQYAKIGNGYAKITLIN